MSQDAAAEIPSTAAQRDAPRGCVAVYSRGNYTPLEGRQYVYVSIAEVEQAIAKRDPEPLTPSRVWDPESNAWVGSSLDEIKLDPGAGDAVLTAYRAYESFANAKTPVDAAYALKELHDAMSDMATWLPGYNSKTGEVEDLLPETPEREREDTST